MAHDGRRSDPALFGTLQLYGILLKILPESIAVRSPLNQEQIPGTEDKIS